MTQAQPNPRIRLLQFAALGLVQGLALVVPTVHAVTSFVGADVTMAARLFVVMAPVLYMLAAQPGGLAGAGGFRRRRGAAAGLALSVG